MANCKEVNQSIGIYIILNGGGRNMQYEKPKMELLILNLNDVICTSTPDKEAVGDNDNWTPLD